MNKFKIGFVILSILILLVVCLRPLFLVQKSVWTDISYNFTIMLYAMLIGTMFAKKNED